MLEETILHPSFDNIVRLDTILDCELHLYCFIINHVFTFSLILLLLVLFLKGAYRFIHVIYIKYRTVFLKRQGKGIFRSPCPNKHK